MVSSNEYFQETILILILSEASEPIDTSISRADTFASRAQDSASKAREKLAQQFEPGTPFPHILYHAVRFFFTLSYVFCQKNLADIYIVA